MTLANSLPLSAATAELKDKFDVLPGATAEAMTASRGSTPLVLIYKVMGKMFAILSVRGAGNVILKCDPHLADGLRSQYSGIGHRSHLDRRFWISVELVSDVPDEEIWQLALHSYSLVIAKLTRKQKSELDAMKVSETQN